MCGGSELLLNVKRNVASVVLTLITYELGSSSGTRTIDPCPGTVGQGESVYMLYPAGGLVVTSQSCVSWRYTHYG